MTTNVKNTFLKGNFSIFSRFCRPPKSAARGDLPTIPPPLAGPGELSVKFDNRIFR